MTKQNIDKEKTAQICRFFTLWGYFHPYTNRGRKKKILLESFEQKARLGAQEHPKRKSMAQGSRIDSPIFQLQTTSISDITIGFSTKNIVSTKRACIFHTPKSSVHMRKSRTFVLERNRVEERTTIKCDKILRFPSSELKTKRLPHLEGTTNPHCSTVVERPQLSGLLISTECVHL